ncbi:MAG TPA: ribonuclease P protein component [Succinivibrionaceae bacterium]|nr:ribonuclease P protein component [Succinivibrionaceae bacterium]
MADNTFPRKDRILTSGDYDKVFQHCIRASVRGVLVLGHKSEIAEHPRLGLVIPKKVLKRAVWRNRVKRVAREAFRLSKNSYPSVDFVVIAKPGIKDINNTELTRILLDLWDQISRRLPA